MRFWGNLSSWRFTNVAPATFSVSMLYKSGSIENVATEIVKLLQIAY